jgi:DUF4097 and DUF4098 domain-containing protein YvlB
VCLLAAAQALPARGEAVLIAEEASGKIPIGEERRVVFEGIKGGISIEVGEPGQLTFSSTLGGEKAKEFPIGVWLDGTVLGFRPIEGAADLPRVLRVQVPPRMATSLHISHTRLDVSNVSGGVEVEGTALDISAGALEGSISIIADQSKIRIAGGTASVAIRGKGLEVQLDTVGSDATVRLAGGSLLATNLQGQLDAEADDARVKLTEATSLVRLRLRGGSAEVENPRAGGEIVLDRAPLKLSGECGNLTLETDADIQFNETEGSLVVRASGGSVRGKSNRGPLEVTSSGGTVVNVEAIIGPVKIQGDSMDLRLKDLASTMEYVGAGSQIALESATGPVSIVVDAGTVSASKVFGAISVKGKNTDVRLADLNGPVDVDVDGQLVEVSWLSMPSDKDSTIKNSGGSVTLRFPASGGGRLEAESRRGDIESNLPRVRVLDGAGSAQGIVGNISRPRIKVEADGDVILQTTAASQGEQP